MADRLEHALHLAVASLVQDELDASAAKTTCAGRRGAAVVEVDALAERAHRGLVRISLPLRLVDLLDAVARVREPVRERAVVREEKRAGRVGVEAADGND